MAKRTRAAKSTELPAQIDLIVLVIIIAFGILVRVRLLDLPLGRDEGEYAYAGQLLLQGVPPYSQAYNMKFPGMYVLYAVVMAVFGQTITGIRIGLIVATSATALLLYFLTRRLFGRTAALIAAAAYTLFSLEPTLLGLYAHATHFVNLAVVAALLLLARSAAERNHRRRRAARRRDSDQTASSGVRSVCSVVETASCASILKTAALDPFLFALR